MLKAILFTTIKNSICKKFWKLVQVTNFVFFFKLRCLAKHSSRHLIFLIFSNIEEPYDKLPKQLNSAITKVFYCFSRRGGRGGGVGWKWKKHKNCENFTFFWFLNLHNLLERVYPYKFQNTLNYFLIHQKKKKKKTG